MTFKRLLAHLDFLGLLHLRLQFKSVALNNFCGQTACSERKRTLGLFMLRSFKSQLDEVMNLINC